MSDEAVVETEPEMTDAEITAWLQVARGETPATPVAKSDLHAAILEWIVVAKGGPGSGQVAGHTFEGNQWSTQQTSDARNLSTTASHISRIAGRSNDEASFRNLKDLHMELEGEHQQMADDLGGTPQGRAHQDAAEAHAVASHFAGKAADAAASGRDPSTAMQNYASTAIDAAAKSEAAADSMSGVTKSVEVAKGGPGSGAQPGHAFEGNQYANGGCTQSDEDKGKAVGAVENIRRGQDAFTGALGMGTKNLDGSHYYGSLQDDDHMADARSFLADGHMELARQAMERGQQAVAANHLKAAHLAMDMANPDKGSSTADIQHDTQGVMDASTTAMGNDGMVTNY